MSARTWTPGEYPTAITNRGIFILEPGNEDSAEQFWRLMREGADLPKLLQELTSSHAADLASLPSFVAIIDEGAGAHIAVRGAFELVVGVPEGPRTLTSGSVITWSEHRFPSISGWRIFTPVSASDSTPRSWSAESAVLPVSMLSSGTVGEVALGHAADPEDQKASARHRIAPASTDAPDESAVGETPVDDAIHTLTSWHDPDEKMPEPSSPRAPAGEPVVAASPYDDLVSNTKLGTVEDAAVRNVRNSDAFDADEPDPVPLPPQPEHLVEPEPSPLGASSTPPTPLAPLPPPPLPTPPVFAADIETPPMPDGGFLIDSVPGVERAEEEERVESTGEQISDLQGDHDGNTVLPSRARGLDTPAAHARHEAAPAVDGLEGDHDGQTVLPSRARQLRDHARSISEPAHQETPVDGPLVLAVLCTQGHPNPTHASSCRICSGEMTDSSARVPRPPLGSIILSTGETLSLDRDVIIGRRPRYVPEPGRPEARIVAVPSPGKQISRSHCEVRIDDWDVRVRDLGSNNGTYLHRPGETPVRLKERVPVVMRPGDVIDIGEGVSFRMESS